MATTYTNAIVTTRAAGTISRPNEYMGNVKSIPVSITIGAALVDDDVLVLTETFGQNTKLVGFTLTNTDLGTVAELDLYAGSGGTALGTITATAAGTTHFLLAPTDISETAIIAIADAMDTGAAGSLVGHLLITDDW